MFIKKIARLALFFSFILLLLLINCKKTPTTPDVEALTRPVIWLNSFELSFTASEAGANPSAQILQVKNSGQNTLNYTVSSEAEWVSLSPASGSSAGEIVEHTVSIDKKGLAAQEEDYSAKITINSSDAYNNPQNVNVTLKLTKKPPPIIEVTPAALTFSAKKGTVTNPSSKSIQIKNTGEQTLNYSVSDNASWLSVSPKNGNSTGQENTHNVSVDINGLEEGTHKGKITITDSNASNNPQTVEVTLTIAKKPPPEIWVSTYALTFSAKKGGSNPSAQSIKIKNSGEQTLNYSISDDANWLSVSPVSGSSTGGEKTHTVSVNISGLGEGTHKGAITITDSNASNSPQTIGVTLNIAKQQPPAIWVSPSSLTFSAQEGGSNPSAQSIKIKNSGDQTLNYSLSDDANWLSVSPTTGSSSGGENTHTVSVNISGLSVGTYNGTITITDSNASNNPQTVSVSLKISEQQPPEIWVSPSSLTFSAQEGGSNPSSQSIKIKNSGDQTLNYSVSDDANWLSVSPASGSSTGGENTHTVSVNINGLNEGTYNGTITITDSNASNSPQTVSVSLKISEQQPPEIWVSPSSLSFSAQEGGSNPSSQSIRIKNSGGQTLNYSITDNANWLSVNPTSGSSSGGENNHTVSVNISGLGSGTHSGSITITDSNASNSPQTVSVSLKISEQQPPEIWVSPSSLSFSAQEGGSSPSAQSIKIKNSGDQTLNYSVSDDANWLSVSPTSGSSTGGENTHTVSVNISGLSSGTHTGTITITDSNASNSPQTVSVALTINEQLPPEIWVSPSSLSFSAQEGGSDPSSQSIGIKNSGDQTLSYSITDDESWLSVNPESGTSTGGENTHTVSVDISGLGSGTHSATITITDPNASNSPRTVSMTLNLSSPPSGDAISISCSPSSGGTGTEVSIPITINGNPDEIMYFGLKMTFDTNVFQFVGVSKGSLTGDWATVDGNNASGTITIGGYTGSGTPIPAGSSGTIAIVTLRVTCSSCSNGQTSQIQINNYTDDIAGMTPEPASTTFTYNN